MTTVIVSLACDRCGQSTSGMPISPKRAREAATVLVSQDRPDPCLCDQCQGVVKTLKKEEQDRKNLSPSEDIIAGLWESLWARLPIRHSGVKEWPTRAPHYRVPYYAPDASMYATPSMGTATALAEASYAEFILRHTPVFGSTRRVYVTTNQGQRYIGSYEIEPGEAYLPW